jgi:Transmembrane secretion effector
VADPVHAAPEELEAELPPPRRARATALLERRDFRRLYTAIAASELGDALHYVALMWVALEAGGPLGVVAVRLADSVPALIFGLHGGLAADRWDRRRLMIAADLTRAVVLVPVAVGGLTGHLPIWGLVLAAFALATATCYFAPAYGAVVPALVGRENVQQANALVQATAQALSIGGWAIAAGLLAVLPISIFFAANAATFLVSAALIAGIGRAAGRVGHAEPPRLREGFAALRPRPALAAGVAVLGAAVTISAGTWIAGVPTLVRDTLGQGAGGFSLVMAGYAVGSIAGGVALARFPVRRKALVSMLAWILYLPAYGLMALGGTLGIAIAGAFAAGLGQGSSIVLLTAAAQEDVPDALLGRVLGLISLVHRGAHATGLILVAPLFAVVEPRSVFAGAAIALPAVGVAGALTARAAAARARATDRTRRS